MINPRKLWKTWRGNLHSSPRFRLAIRRNENDDDPFDQESHLPSTPQTPSPASSQNVSPASLTFTFESPPSPVPDDDAKGFPKNLHLTPQYYLHHNDDDDSSNYSVTPPSSNPFPLMVSAKRLSTDIRSQHKRRRANRRRLRDQSNLIPTTMGWRDTSPTDNKEYDNRNPLASHTDEEEPIEDAWHIDTTTWSPTARSQHYWNICYGLEISEVSKSKRLPLTSWSAQRCPPTKSCLSSIKKRRRRTTLPASFMTSHSSPSILVKSSDSTSSQQTPIVNILSSDKKSVQFGALSAAEFRKDEPTSSAIKPLPQEDADRLFCSPKEITLQEKEQTDRTKTNAKILADWETSFQSDDDADQLYEASYEESVKKRRRRSTGKFLPFVASLNDRSECYDDDNGDNVMDIVSDTTTRQIPVDQIPVDVISGAT